MESELSNEYEYFEKSSFSTINEKLIKEQGVDICRSVISANYILTQNATYDFGFIRKTPIAQIGQSKKRKKTQYVASVVLCKVFPEFKQVDITLLCSRPNVRDGKRLMKMVEQKASSTGYEYLSVLSIGDERVMNFYKTIGFKLISEHLFPTGEIKAYSMRKTINLV
jgi:N-acetylglutamate synthase-like GNAT family acetyltransferase